MNVYVKLVGENKYINKCFAEGDTMWLEKYIVHMVTVVCKSESEMGWHFQNAKKPTISDFRFGL